MMRWFFPSWNGDFRLEAISKDGNYREASGGEVEGASTLIIHEPTAAEREHLGAFLKEARKKGWTRAKLSSGDSVQRINLKASVQDAGEALLKITAPKAGAITAVRSEDGKVNVADTRDVKQTAKLVKNSKSKDAATVKRPTMCCPHCIPGSIEPASEVLLSFLTEEEHRTWASRRAIVVRGGVTGHRYVVAHRHSKLAQQMGKITWDLDLNCIVHCHDWSVPPEEEVLAIKLLLEHREPWVRNEASLYHFARDPSVFSNTQFGGIRDGVADSAFVSALGSAMRGLVD